MLDEPQSTSPADLTVTLRVGQEEHPAHVADISFYGVTLRTPLIVPVGSFLPLRFRLATGDEVLLHGIVSQVRPRLRVRFEGLSARQFDELAALVADVRRRGGESTQPLIDREAIKEEADIKTQIAALSAEVARLRDQVNSQTQPPKPAESWTSSPSLSSSASSSLKTSRTSSSVQTPVTPTVVALLTAIDPMLWGLEEAVKFLGQQIAKPTPEQELHLRHLHLLQKLLVRLNAEVLR